MRVKQICNRLEARVKKLETALSAILNNFDQALAKLDIMERAKLNRERKLDAIIDNLDGVSSQGLRQTNTASLL